jgi:hypothetical protein
VSLNVPFGGLESFGYRIVKKLKIIGSEEREAKAQTALNRFHNLWVTQTLFPEFDALFKTPLLPNK